MKKLLSMRPALLVLLFSVVAFAQEPLTDAQRAEHFKLQAKLLGAASNVNLTQLQLQEAQKQAQAAGEAFTAAKAAYEAHLLVMCKGAEPDNSTDEPKCKPKAEDPKTDKAVPEPHAGGKDK